MWPPVRDHWSCSCALWACRDCPATMSLVALKAVVSLQELVAPETLAIERWYLCRCCPVLVCLQPASQPRGYRFRIETDTGANPKAAGDSADLRVFVDRDRGDIQEVAQLFRSQGVVQLFNVICNRGHSALQGSVVPGSSRRRAVLLCPGGHCPIPSYRYRAHRQSPPVQIGHPPDDCVTA
jgi:hypothetical protein